MGWISTLACGWNFAARISVPTVALFENRKALADLNGQWIDRFHDRNGLKYIVLDINSSVSPTHGDQEGAAWNGHFDCTCYHPNFLFNQFGMLERCTLRNGNVHSAEGWRDVQRVHSRALNVKRHATWVMSAEKSLF